MQELREPVWPEPGSSIWGPATGPAARPGAGGASGRTTGGARARAPSRALGDPVVVAVQVLEQAGLDIPRLADIDDALPWPVQDVHAGLRRRVPLNVEQGVGESVRASPRHGDCPLGAELDSRDGTHPHPVGAVSVSQRRDLPEPAPDFVEQPDAVIVADDVRIERPA